jgi:hypothetical protein
MSPTSTAGPAREAPRQTPVSADVLRLFRDAVINRLQAGGRRNGRAVRMWPHALGRRGGELFVLGFMLTAGEPQASRWEWIPLAEVDQPWSGAGIWIGSPRGYRPPSDFLDVVIADAEDGEP